MLGTGVEVEGNISVQPRSKIYCYTICYAILLPMTRWWRYGVWLILHVIYQQWCDSKGNSYENKGEHWPDLCGLAIPKNSFPKWMIKLAAWHEFFFAHAYCVQWRNSTSMFFACSAVTVPYKIPISGEQKSMWKWWNMRKTWEHHPTFYANRPTPICICDPWWSPVGRCRYRLTVTPDSHWFMMFYSLKTWYPLVICYTAIENGHLVPWLSYKNVVISFSIADC